MSEARISIPSPLAAPAVVAERGTFARVSIPSPLHPPRAYVLNDWTMTVPVDSQIYYACELQHEGERLRLPISSWQATIQNDRKSYLQAVVPAVADLIDQIAAMADGDLVIFRGVRRPDDSTNELEMARVPIGQMPYQRGPNRASVNISGYGDISFEEMGEGEVGPKRHLTGVRSLSVQGGTRTRSDIDWLLRPGMTAVVADQEFTVAFINYYVNASQAFMDAGERQV